MAKQLALPNHIYVRSCLAPCTTLRSIVRVIDSIIYLINDSAANMGTLKYYKVQLAQCVPN